MTPLEKYQAYRISGGLSETPATVTRPQSYNIRSGGVSQAEKSNIQRIKDRQAADKEANKIQQEKYWNLNLSKGTPKQEPIKQMDARARAKLATETGIEMGDLTKVTKAITQSQTEQTGAWMKIHSMQEPELPLAAESPVKQNDFLPPSETSEQIFEIPPINSGRIELNPSMPEQKIIEKIAHASTPAKSDNSKYFAIGGITIAALVLFLILRRRK